MPPRRQATLYLPESCSKTAERIRSRYNPLQAQLIRAHVTLCREDEVADWEHFKSRLLSVGEIAISLTFNEIVRRGNLVYASAENTDSFHRLRRALLATGSFEPRRHNPHLTLIHPRNGSCDDKTFHDLQTQFTPFKATFDSVTIIEQAADGPWRDLFRYPAMTSPDNFGF